MAWPYINTSILPEDYLLEVFFFFWRGRTNGISGFGSFEFVFLDILNELTIQCVIIVKLVYITCAIRLIL
jgi:hypothetical protein